jgi:hypothetical protein
VCTMYAQLVRDIAMKCGVCILIWSRRHCTRQGN